MPEVDLARLNELSEELKALTSNVGFVVGSEVVPNAPGATGLDLNTILGSILQTVLPLIVNQLFTPANVQLLVNLLLQLLSNVKPVTPTPFK